MAACLVLAQACPGSTTYSATLTKALDQACRAAIEDKSRSEALETIEAVIEGRPIEAINAAAQRAGLKGYFPQKTMWSDGYRRYALEVLGRTGLQEALDYLSALTPQTIGRDDALSLLPQAKIELKKALLRRQVGSSQQIAFLRAELASPLSRHTAHWAVNELCDRGDVDSIGAIRQFLEDKYRQQSGDPIASCKSRMDIVNSHPDRARALGSALRLDTPSPGNSLIGWAVEQLIAMESPAADAELERYATEVERGLSANTGLPLQESEDSWFHCELARKIRLRGLQR